MIKQVVVSPFVIGIGNIAVGGSGKTPFLLHLLKDLDAYKIAVIMRAYRSQIRYKAFAKVTHAHPQFGDEPLLVKQSFPGLDVFIGQSKSHVASKLNNASYEGLIVDDAMQHHRLKKDSNILMISSNHLQEKWMIPAGRLREPFSNLKNVDLVVFHNCCDEREFQNARRYISQYAGCPIIGTAMHLDANVLKQITNKQIGVFCAIGSPEPFLEVLQKHASIVKSRIYPDHARFSQQAIEQFAKECLSKGASLLVCTEKDHVKIPKDIKCSLPIICAKAKLTVVFNNEEYLTFVSKIKTQMRHL